MDAGAQKSRAGHAFRTGILTSPWEECVEFDQWVCKTGKHQLHTDISTKGASPRWSGGSRRTAVKGKMRKNVSLVHQEL